MKGINDLLPILGFETSEDLLNGLKSFFLTKGFSWFDNQLIGLRTSDDYDNHFTDWILAVEGDNITAVTASTKAGSYWLATKAVATLKECQYIDLWTKGQTAWSGDPYLQQINNCDVYRDGLKSGSIDRDAPVEHGNFGINFHSWKNFGENLEVYNLSEGCQVTQEVENAAIFEVINDWEKITYTLIFTPEFLS